MSFSADLPTSVRHLLDRGVTLPLPASVWVSDEVNPERIDPSVTLYPGTRLSGKQLSIGPGCVIGGECPATVDNCQLGRGVNLKGGFFSGSVFLDGSSVGSSAHIRPGCLFEEQASAAHAVGCKQTILFPYATLGSLINFCDVLLAGGTGSRDHSEVGSSFIHFNFTPHADKATASLLGDVPRGVLLNQPPVFLGGQGGLVGPVIAEYGVIQAAGSVSRSHLDRQGHLYREGGGSEPPRPYQTGAVRDPAAKLHANLLYLGNLSALSLWYRAFRLPREKDPFSVACLQGGLDLLEQSVAERRKRLTHWAGLVGSDDGPPDIFQTWSTMESQLDRLFASPSEGRNLMDLGQRRTGSYLDVVTNFKESERQLVQQTLQQEINRFTMLVDQNGMERIP